MMHLVLFLSFVCVFLFCLSLSTHLLRVCALGLLSKLANNKRVE
jgi:hypothetical protein